MPELPKQTDKTNLLIDALYDSISEAEFRDGTPHEKRWIRTRHRPPQGSSAFGPVQITRTKAVDYADRKLISKDSKETVRQMTPMWDKMLKLGATPHAGEYDYGKSGNFSPEQREAYIRMAKDLIKADLKRADGDIEKMLELWRGADRRADSKYFDAFFKKLKEQEKKD